MGLGNLIKRKQIIKKVLPEIRKKFELGAGSKPISSEYETLQTYPNYGWRVYGERLKRETNKLAKEMQASGILNIPNLKQGLENYLEKFDKVIVTNSYNSRSRIWSIVNEDNEPPGTEYVIEYATKVPFIP